MKRSALKRIVSIGCLTAAIACAVTASAQEKRGAAPLNVAILLLNGSYATEFAGPLDVYHHVSADKLKVFTVSDTPSEIATYEGLSVRANYTIDNAPKIDVLVIPSGSGSLGIDQKNQRVISWIRKVSGQTRLITSHCEGAFLLGEAGLLDRRNATTFPTDRDALQAKYPACRVNKENRIVVDGNLVTSAGGLASYEAALYVVDRLFGKEVSSTVAKNLVFGQSNTQAAEKAEGAVRTN